MLHYNMLQILASTSLHLKAKFGYKSLSSLYSEFVSGEFPCHFRMGIPLHSRNFLALLVLQHGVTSCIKRYSFCGKNAFTLVLVCISQSLQSSPCNCRVWRKQYEKYHAKCI